MNNLIDPIFMAFNPFEALFSGIGGLFSLIHLIIWVTFAIEIFKGNLSTLSKVLWILVILWLPYVGLAIYYFFGRPKMLHDPYNRRQFDDRRRGDYDEDYRTID